MIALDEIKLACNPKTKGSILRELSQQDNTNLKILIAFNPSTPKDVFKELLKTKNSRVFEGLASNVSTPVTIRAMIIKQVLKEAKKKKQSRGSEYKTVVVLTLPYIESKKIRISKADVYTLISIYKPEATNLEILEEVMRLQGGKLKRRNK